MRQASSLVSLLTPVGLSIEPVIACAQNTRMSEQKAKKRKKGFVRNHCVPVRLSMRIRLLAVSAIRMLSLPSTHNPLGLLNLAVSGEPASAQNQR
jgi:hypothetical protein